MIPGPWPKRRRIHRVAITLDIIGQNQGQHSRGNTASSSQVPSASQLGFLKAAFCVYLSLPPIRMSFLVLNSPGFFLVYVTDESAASSTSCSPYFYCHYQRFTNFMRRKTFCYAPAELSRRRERHPALALPHSVSFLLTLPRTQTANRYLGQRRSQEQVRFPTTDVGSNRSAQFDR